MFQVSCLKGRLNDIRMGLGCAYMGVMSGDGLRTSHNVTGSNVM